MPQWLVNKARMLRRIVNKMRYVAKTIVCEDFVIIILDLPYVRMQKKRIAKPFEFFDDRDRNRGQNHRYTGTGTGIGAGTRPSLIAMKCVKLEKSS